MELARPSMTAAAPLAGLRVVRPGTERGRGMSRADVRPDLEQVFRDHYGRVVAVAARVLGSRDQAEDVAQEVFLSFGRSSVPAGEAGGWPTGAPTHTALNLLPPRRRRTPREEAADHGPTPVPAVADLVITREERSPVRAPLARL